MSEPLLQVQKLDSYYGDFQALFQVDLNIYSGEIIAIIGANGAGKSTLLRSISGLLINESSQIAYQSADIGALRADQVAQLGIALVPEGRQLFPSLSVEENLLLGATVKRSGHWNLKSVYELFTVLGERRKMPSSSLSGGQQQMVAIGRALMANPDLILFDEISLGLAPIIINDIYNALPGIIGSGMTAIIVEQDISRALSVSSRVYCLQEGRVKLEGHTEQLTRQQISDGYFGAVA